MKGVDCKECIVLIPTYKPLEDIDKMVVKQTELMTQGMDIAFILPMKMVMDESFAEFAHFGVERFDDSFFKDIQGYNRLMLSSGFYRRFKRYRYMLIHQLDAYLFKPELSYWCQKDYDSLLTD